MKKFVAIILAVVLSVSFAACGKEKDGVQTVKEGDLNAWYFNDEETETENLFSNAEKTVSPDSVYSSLEYTPEMLYGVYAVNDLENDVKALQKELKFSDVTFDNGTYSVSSMPVAVYSGTEFLPSEEYMFRAVEDIEVAALSFIVGDEIGFVPCKYEINGNKIKYTALNDTSKDDKFSYELDSNVFEYEFSIKGPYLTLTDGTDSISLKAFSFTDNVESDISIRAYSAEGSPLIDDLDFFVSQQDSFINFAVIKNAGYYNNSACKMTDDGNFIMYLKKKDKDGNSQEFVKQYAYIMQSTGVSYFNSFSIILFDGEKTYFYNDSDTEREARILESDGIDVEKLEEEKLEEIAEKKSDLYNDLSTEFEQNGISVSINRSTGEIMMDAKVLFGGDSADITKEGKAFLDKFVDSYTKVVFNEKYDGFISKTVVEGHIAPVSGVSYESGMPLSEKRANNVMKYCVDSNEKLKNNMEAVGLSNSRPVYDSDGKVDFDSSRRVSFKCIVNVED